MFHVKLDRSMRVANETAEVNATFGAERNAQSDGQPDAASAVQSAIESNHEPDVASNREMSCPESEGSNDHSCDNRGTLSQYIDNAHQRVRSAVRTFTHSAEGARPLSYIRELPWSLKVRFAAWLELGRFRLTRRGSRRVLTTTERTYVLPPSATDVRSPVFRRELALAATRQPQADVLRETALASAVPMPLPAHHIEVLGGARRCTKEPATNLVVGFIVDPKDRESWITHADIARWNLNVDTLYDAAVENLWRATQGAVVLQEDVTGREIYHIRHGDGLDSSRLLLAKLWAQVSDTCGDSLIICAPSRGKIYAAPADQPSSIERLTNHVTGDWATHEDRVSPALWIWQEGALHRWAAHA